MAGFRILIADDDQDDFDLISSMLFDLENQYEINRAVHGEQLLAGLQLSLQNKSGLPDLVLLDINMPRIDGIQALARIKANKALSSIPVIVYTTSASRGQAKHCFGLGANGFVTKGASLRQVAEFARQVNDFLHKRCEIPGSNKLLIK